MPNEMRGFTLGSPRLVCRWRLAERTVVLENRHLRALSQRIVCGRAVSPQLVAWAKQHIEWTLAEGSAEYPDGVLMLIMDEEGRAAMTVGPYEPLAATTASALADRARVSEREATETGVPPETLWVVSEGALVCGMSPDDRPSGATTLMTDLAKTLGMPVSRRPRLAEELLAGSVRPEEVFLVSDEHGVVPAAGADGPRARRFAEGYEKLLLSARERER